MALIDNWHLYLAFESAPQPGRVLGFRVVGVCGFRFSSLAFRVFGFRAYNVLDIAELRIWGLRMRVNRALASRDCGIG